MVSVCIFVLCSEHILLFILLEEIQVDQSFTVTLLKGMSKTCIIIMTRVFAIMLSCEQ